MANQPSKYKKFVVTAASAALVASAVAPVASAAYTDTTSLSTADMELVTKATDLGFFQGDGSNFNPYNQITRGQVVKVLARQVAKEAGQSVDAYFASKKLEEKTVPFTDVPATHVDKELFKSSLIVKDSGVFEGNSNVLNFSQNISRQQMASVLVRAFDLKTVEGVDSTVTDSNNAGSHKENIDILSQNGVTVVTEFNPLNDLSRLQMARFVVRAHEVANPAELKVVSATATDAKTLSVTLSDEKTHVVTLEKALTANTATEVTFTINKKKYTTTVTWVVVTPVVESVSAINGSTLQMKFTSPVSKDIIDSASKNLKAATSNAITLNGTAIGTLPAELSEDGKTLTVYSTSTAWDKSYTVKVARDVIAGQKEGTWVEGFEGVVAFNDSTRPTIESVTPVSKYVFDVNLSEPVKSPITPTAKYTDGSGSVNVVNQVLRNNNKTIRVTLNSSTTVNKEVSLLFPALTDITGNIQVPTVTKVTVTNADITKPTLSSTKALSDRVIEVKFSEELGQDALALANIKVNNIALSGSDTAVVKSTDPTVVVVTLVTSSAITSDIVPVTFALDTVKDLAGNGNVAFSTLVNVSADKTGPVLASSKVVADTTNKLKLVFDEAIKTTPAADVNAFYMDTFGVKQELKIESSTMVLDSTDTSNKTVLVDLKDGASVALAANVDYTIEFAEGDFTDNFNNKSKAFNVNFNNNGSATPTKLKLDGGIAGTTKPGTISVKFDQAVDPVTAGNIANYSVEGSTIKKATLVANSTAGATVDLELTDGSVEVTGNYNVTVQNVKGFYSSIVAMSTTTQNIAINENVRPGVVNVVVNEFTGSATNLTLTFSEAVSSNALGADMHYELFIDGTKAAVGETVTLAAITTANTGTVTIAKDLSVAIAAGKVVTLKPVTTNDIKDAKLNKIKNDVITVK